jgi:DNA invertase Pin-like site-specific DNA recombinase
MRIALYCRVSTEDQSTEMQRRELTEYFERRGWTVAATYEDIGVSGATDSRPELNRLMADASKRKFDGVVVWKFDRFARSVSHLLRALEEFRALGIEFCSYSESADTSTPAGKLVFTILGAVAEMERSLIQERVRAGMKNAKANGKHVGRPKAVVNSDEIRAMISAGQSMAEIGSILGISAATVCRRAQLSAW